jgi:FR47-like protein
MMDLSFLSYPKCVQNVDFYPKQYHKYFSAPSNITLKPLSLDDASIVNDEWSNNCVGSHFLVKRLIEWNPNIGAYNENNELMGWCLRLQSGPLGALQVRKKFMRLGVGSLCIVAMSKIHANMNLDTFALINEGNFNSQNLFVKMGFKHTDDAYWLRTRPTNGKKAQWSDEDIYY